MAATDAKPIPIKNTAYRVTFPIFDADGDLVSGAAGLDSEVSKDGGTFADCTNEATEIATSSGMYYLDLTADEMNADTVAIIVKTSTSGAKTTPIVLYPAESTDQPPSVAAIADAVWDEALSGHAGAGSAGEALSNAGSGASAADIADAVWDEATTGHTTAGTFGEQCKTDVDAILADTGADGVVVAAASKTGYALATAEHTNIADALLKRDWTSVTGEAARSVLNALRSLRNKVSISGTTLTVTKEDDSTSAWTATVTTDAAADPVTAVDPA